MTVVTTTWRLADTFTRKQGFPELRLTDLNVARGGLVLDPDNRVSLEIRYEFKTVEELDAWLQENHALHAEAGWVAS